MLGVSSGRDCRQPEGQPRNVTKDNPGTTGQLAASPRPIDNALARIRTSLPQMSKIAGRIAEFVLARPQDVVGMSITELAEAASASEGSVINFCRGIGLSGFQQLKLSIDQEIVQPVQFIHEDLNRDDSIETVCRRGPMLIRDFRRTIA